MLTKKQREKLRKIKIFDFASLEKYGIPFSRHIDPKIENTDWIVETKFEIPRSSETAENVFEKILECGFSKVKRVSPYKANCIVRVYKRTHLKYDADTIYNIYGADVYTQKGLHWITKDEYGDYFELDFTGCIHSMWLCQDEKLTFDADFVDYYVKVS